MAQMRRDLKRSMQELQDVWDTRIEPQMNNPIAKKRTATATLLHVLIRIVMLGFSGFVVWTAYPGSSLFSWHPTLMSLAFMLLMPEAILMYSPWFSNLMGSPRSQKTQWHWLLHAAAMCCAYTGLAIITYNKYINKAAHYTSWHGLAGIVVCCLLAVQATGGVLAMYPDVLPIRIKRLYIKWGHASSGTFITFSGAMAAIGLGLYSTWFTSHVSSPVIKTLCIACPIIIELTVLIQFAWNYVMLCFK